VADAAVQHFSQHQSNVPERRNIMTRTHKSTRTAGAAEKTELLDTFIPLYAKNFEQVAVLRKKALETFAEQSAELIDAWKKAFHAVPNTPGLFLFDLMGQNFVRYVEAEKGVIDLAVEQTHALASLTHERGASTAKILEGLTNLCQQAAEHSVALHKKTLDQLAEQHKSAYETAKKQFRFAGTPGAEAYQTGLDALIETQKAMVDIASKPLRHTAAA
jgi:ABC-type uncharacterized transport system involved in gliding motility auxiliary subunit